MTGFPVARTWQNHEKGGVVSLKSLFFHVTFSLWM